MSRGASFSVTSRLRLDDIVLVTCDQDFLVSWVNMVARRICFFFASGCS